MKAAGPARVGMRRVRCGELGGTGCDAEVTGASEEDIRQRLWDHLERSHRRLVADMGPEKRAEVLERIRHLAGRAS